MKKITFLLSLTIVLGIIIYSCKNNSSDSADESKACDCDTKWFPHQQTPNTIDGAAGPFNVSSTTNCMFHQLAMQKFMWLTRSMSSGNAFFQDSLLQVNVNLQTVKPDAHYPNIALVLNDTAQASSNGSLHSNPALATDGNTHMVYYSKFINQTLMDACKKFKDSLFRNISLLDSNGITFPDSSLELKVSWVSIKAIPLNDRKKYYTTQAVIQATKDTIADTVALLGMHVVTRVYNHPEFIWATFEHNDLAANYDWKTSTAQKESPIISDKDLLFFVKKETNGREGITWPYSPQNQPKAFSVFKYGTPRTNGDFFMPYTSQYKNNGDSTNYLNIKSLNNSFIKNLSKEDVWSNYFYNGAIWLNMDGLDSTAQVNRLWKNAYKGFHFIEIDSTSDARGSLACKNITMETYTQVFDTINKLTATASEIGNCFGCHNGFTQPSNISSKEGFSPLYYSHVFNHYLRYDEKKDKGEALAKKRDNDALIKKLKGLKLK